MILRSPLCILVIPSRLVLTLCSLWTVALQAPLSMGFPGQEHWSALPFPSLAPLPNPGIELVSTVYPALQVDSLTTTPGD